MAAAGLPLLLAAGPSSLSVKQELAKEEKNERAEKFKNAIRVSVIGGQPNPNLQIADHDLPPSMRTTRVCGASSSSSGYGCGATGRSENMWAPKGTHGIGLEWVHVPFEQDKSEYEKLNVSDSDENEEEEGGENDGDDDNSKPRRSRKKKKKTKKKKTKIKAELRCIFRAGEKDVETQLYEQYELVGGMDEVGLGAVAGPLTVCVMVVERGAPLVAGVRDSKLFSSDAQKEKRAQIAQRLMRAKGHYWNVGSVHPKVFFEIGHSAAYARAITLALERLPPEKRPQALLIDGVDIPSVLLPSLSSPSVASAAVATTATTPSSSSLLSPESNVEDVSKCLEEEAQARLEADEEETAQREEKNQTITRGLPVKKEASSAIAATTATTATAVKPSTKWAPCPVRAIVSADAQTYVVAAASIIAKYMRDAWMTKLAESCPSAYQLGKNMGYGTKAHGAALRKLGLIEGIHRPAALSMISKAKGDKDADDDDGDDGMGGSDVNLGNDIIGGLGKDIIGGLGKDIIGGSKDEPHATLPTDETGTDPSVGAHPLANIQKRAALVLGGFTSNGASSEAFAEEDAILPKLESKDCGDDNKQTATLSIKKEVIIVKDRAPSVSLGPKKSASKRKLVTDAAADTECAQEPPPQRQQQQHKMAKTDKPKVAVPSTLAKNETRQVTAKREDAKKSAVSKGKTALWKDTPELSTLATSKTAIVSSSSTITNKKKGNGHSFLQAVPPRPFTSEPDPWQATSS